MSKGLAVYFEEDDYWKFKEKVLINDDKPMSNVVKRIIKEHYLEEDDPQVEIKNITERDNTKRYDFRVSDEFYLALEEKLALMNHKNKSEVITKLIKKYYLGE